jgi:twitching motility protein PilJ
MNEMESQEMGKPNSRFDVLALLETIGCKSLRMKILAGSVIYTALSIGLICLVVYFNLSATAGANQQQGVEQTGKALVLSGLIAFAVLGSLLFMLSEKVARSLAETFSGTPSDLSGSLFSQSFTDSAQAAISEEASTSLTQPLLAMRSSQASESEPVGEELRRSHALLHAILNSLPQNIFCKTPEGRYLFVNQAFSARMQSSPESIIGKTDADLFPAAAHRHSDDKKVIETAEALETVTEDADADGKKLYLQVVKTPTYDEGGKIIGMQGISWDITQSKLAEQALLRESDLLNAIMKSSSDFIYFKDLDSRFIRISSALHFGLADPADAVGKSDFDFFTAEHAQPAFDDEQRIIRTQQSLVGIEERETWADKEDTWASTTKNPLYDREGNVIGTFGITRNITERKRAEEALERNLAEFLTFVSKVSEGDLTLRSKEAEDTLGLVAQSVNKMLDNFSAMLTEVKKHGLSVSSSASQILVAAEDIEAGTQQQTDEITNTTSSVEEMAVCMGQISKNAEASADAARRALGTAERGGISVQDTSEAMVRINSAVEQTADKMRLLGQRSKEISEIIDLIKDIASQTNLLSLNAAIQAAHAGEAGLGFSVVADEIRKLAERSGHATKNVSNLIKAIQKETVEALSATENGLKEVKNGSVLAEQSRQALEDISGVVKQSVQLIEEISVASEEQARVTRNLATAMQTISGITMEASAGSHQTAQIIHGMVDLSDSLNQSLSQFQVKDSFLHHES